MPLFDVYVMTDWSAASTPTRPEAPNTIWAACRGPEGQTIKNFTTRRAAMEWLSELFIHLIGDGKRVFAGFDFSFGYPAGAAAAITGEGCWQHLWAYLANHIDDDDGNANNRFEVANALNASVFAEAPKFWGRPSSRDDLKALPSKKEVLYDSIVEHRLAERYFSRVQPVWKMFTTGSVGGQSMMGIARLEQLRRDPRLQEHVRVWPFETAFDASLPAQVGIVIAELYPSAFPVQQEAGEVLDRAQVRSVVAYLADADRQGELCPLLAPPPDSAPAEQALMLAEEGSIIGAGRLLGTRGARV